MEGSGEVTEARRFSGEKIDLKRRGVNALRLVIADGHLGIWSALAQVFPEAEEQRCWDHKILDVRDHFTRSRQAQARELLCQIPYVEAHAEAERPREQFARRFGRDFPKAVETLQRDWHRMAAFYKSPK